MKILILGGTRFFGVYTIRELLAQGYEVTIATRGRTKDEFGDRIERLIVERTDKESMAAALGGRHFDVVIDKLAYASEDVRIAMEVLDCDRYIQMSSTAVYEPKRIDTKESDFDALGKPLVWCDRKAFAYAEIKRQAECALWQKYTDKNFVAVRYPFVIGEDDYTLRLKFYVEHVMYGKAMFVDNIDCQMGYIRSDEAGRFMAFLVDKEFTGAVNGCAAGTISLREIIEYVEQKTGTKAVLCEDGEPAPYNGEPAYSINTEKATELGFEFSELKDWIYELVDYYIEQLKEEKHAF